MSVWKVILMVKITHNILLRLKLPTLPVYSRAQNSQIELIPTVKPCSLAYVDK